MKMMDCGSEELTYASLAAITGVDQEGIRFVVDQEYPPESESDELAIGLLRTADHFSERPHSTCWFHITRVSRNNAFSAGLRPLGTQIDSIWSFLGSLLDEGGKGRLEAFRPTLESETNSHYASKAMGAAHWGPHALLIREAAFRSAEIGNHDYFKAPEIIEDICDPFRADSGIDLLERYRSATEPCIVKFISNAPQPLSLATALAYLRRVRRGEPFDFGCNLCFDAHGSPIERDRILDIEFVGEQQAA